MMPHDVTDLDIEASWNCVLLRTGRPLSRSAHPNPPAKLIAPPSMVATAMPGTPSSSSCPGMYCCIQSVKCCGMMIDPLYINTVDIIL